MMQEVMEAILPTKVINEAAQGSAFMPAAETVQAASAKRFYIESYGCQMNFADSEVVASILQEHGFGATRDADKADLILINTCSIRDKAEQTVRHRLMHLKRNKKQNPGLLVGVLGCMAERLKSKFLEEEKLVDLVVGPDAYRTLPALIAEAAGGQKGVNVLLSREETYADIAPVRLNSNGVSAFVSIMRGCNNMCTFCVVPFTRGRERSRDAASIVAECRNLFEGGYREVTLLGQNVDSYYYTEGTAQPVTFAMLLESVAQISPLLRVRFSTSHPKDITEDVLHTIAAFSNICNNIHLPIQSGSTRMLQMMNRTYTREWYLHKVAQIRKIIPDCGLSTDVIAGFCTETEADHQETLSAMERSGFDYAFMYSYSVRPGTLAARRYEDDVSEADKQRRLEEIISMQNSLSKKSYAADVGKVFEVLIESESKRSSSDWSGRNSQNKMVIFPKGNKALQPGDYALVKVLSATQATLIGVII